MKASDVMATAATVIATLVNVAALVFLAAQVRLAKQAISDSSRAQQEEWQRQRQRDTIRASMETAAYRERLRAILPWNDRDSETVAQFLREIADDETRKAPIREYLNRLTDLAVGWKQGVLDLQTLSLIEGGRIIDVVENLQPYIHQTREDLGRPSIWEDVEELVVALKAHRQDGVTEMAG